ncbi:hypothetical protein [Halorubrum persicum]|uniref:hypothetical protein n=1 Tax=Halorubrum persicum TaxID=1383844 RepID=UPI0015D4E703|nr:hypothetical protein [Halorubrum persicum]
MVDVQDLEAFGLWHELVEEEVTVGSSGNSELELVKGAGDNRDVLGRVAEV